MKTKIYITTFVMMLLISCGQTNEKKNKLPNKKQPVAKTFEQKEKERLEKRAEIEKQYEIDSLRLEKVLTDALRIAEQNGEKNKFKKTYKVSPDIEVELDLDNHFTKDYPHLIVRRHGDDIDDFCIDIYSKVNRKFEKVISHRQWAITYTSDTIKDINGDGLKDFVVNWYGASGCCLKAFSDIYLLRKDQKTFSNSFEFINPTFSPKEKIIRGVEYGHTGETEIYKYQWNGEKVDTLEYVYYDTNKEGKKTGKIIISEKRAYSKNKKDIKKLNSIPAEYTKIEGYDWFTGKGYE
ncbi:hypothetical protein Q1W71_23495 [Flavobacterium pectinovorum]|uniref:XAC2610-related protein n=1 Tax=Flavobacterium pectinovorum TaxID=29533 RepID=UPI00265E1C0F|nr:hypothetical protein [Flavobacterium pectinovorum]WKL47900.1 hypothetical protein Q1W71_23495 [Flavobacterium pectinovorum]